MKHYRIENHYELNAGLEVKRDPDTCVKPEMVGCHFGKSL